MLEPTQDLSDSDPSLDDVLAEYVAAEEMGAAPDRAGFLARHSAHAAELREFFANRDQMQRLAQPLRVEPDGAARRNGHGSLGKVRYFGDYELLDEIAAGGMGVVYKARQVSLNRVVAVKMILRGTLAREEDIRRFRAEAEAAANLQHPGIVPIHEVGLHEGQHYFSMDFVEGRNLAEVLRDEPLSPKQAATYVIAAAEAVHYAHQQGTLHRDLKPSNLLIDKQDRVRITDFGLAKRISGESDLTLSGQILGTPAYMPPEQAAGKRSLIAAPSDVYSLGAVLYECLSGRPPFRGETPSATLRQVETLDPVSPRLLNPAVPRDLETICLKCLEKEPHKRYGAAQLLAEDLGRFLRHEPILARPVGPLSRTLRWCRRKPLVAGLSAVSALASLGALVVLLVSNVLVTSALEDRTKAFSELTTANAKLATEEQNAREALTGKVQALGELEKSNQSLTETVDREQQANYFNHVLLAWREWQAGHVEVAERHLHQCRQDLRSWEWHYIARLCRPSSHLASFERVQGIGDVHDGLVPRGLCVSRNGSRVACLNAERSATVLDVSTGEEVFRPDDARHDIRCLALGPDGVHLAALGSGSLTVWNIDTRRILGERRDLSTAFNRLEFAADGRRLIVFQQSARPTTRDDMLRRTSVQSMTILDADSIKTLASLGYGTESPGLCIHSADGQRFATLHQREGKVHRIENGQTIALAAHDEIIAGGDLSTDGARLVTFDADSNVSVWDSATGARISAWHTRPEKLERIRISPDGTRVATQSFLSNLKVWETERGKLLASYREAEIDRTRVAGTPSVTNMTPLAFHRFLAFSPEGTRLASASGDRKVTVWDLGSGRQTAMKTHEPLVLAAFVASGEQQMLYATCRNHVAAAIGNSTAPVNLHRWSLLSGDESRLIFRPGPFYHTVAVNHSGAKIASISKPVRGQLNTLKVWDTRSGAEVSSIPCPAEGELYDVAFSPDDSQLAVTGQGGVYMLDLATKEIRSPVAKKLQRCHRVVFSQDGKRILVAHGRTGIYDLQTGQEVISFARPSWSASAIFSQDETKVATGGMSGGVFIWNAKTGEQLLDLSIIDDTGGAADRKHVYSVAFSPDSSLLAAGDEIGRVFIWNAISGKRLFQFPAHDGRAYTVAFSPDGKRLISMGDDGVLRVWESKNSKEILTLAGHADRVYSATFTRDGSKIVSTSADGTIRIWDGSPLDPDERG